MSLPLLQTKLYVPPQRPQLVLRPAVTAKLHGSTTLTLIAAPAGFGKTTLVSKWITQTDQPVAWLSLDDDDNNPGQFFLYLIAALRTVHQRVGETTLASLLGPQLPSLMALLTPLLNDLSQLTDPFVLVLDDYHLITAQPVHEALTFLVEHLPPALRLIITTRIDPPLPLARWRVRGQLVEVRADDLRFSTAEAMTFFNGVMGLHLTDIDVAHLERRTEGWIAGLQLAALSMQGRADVPGFIQSFSGSHRHVFTYLVEEVLNQQPAGTLDFLMQTAILERFSADLCHTVTSHHDSQMLLAILEQANLFLIPLDDERQWYRYHHLFAEVLYNQLQQTMPQVIPILHQRAATWFATQELWPEAIRHALAARDFGQAARLIERVGIALFSQPIIQHSLEQWLSTLPTAFISARPRLCLIYTWLGFICDNSAMAFQWLTAAEATLVRQGTPLIDGTSASEVAAETVALRALLMAYGPTMSATEALAYGRQALDALSVDQQGFRCIAAAAMGMAYLKLGDVIGAEEAMAEANRMGRITGNLYMLVAFAASQSAMQRARGFLRRALETCHENLAWLRQRNAFAYPTFGSLYFTLADLLCERNALDDAQYYAETAIVHCNQEINPTIVILSHLVLMRIKRAQGDWPRVWALMAEVSSMIEERPGHIHSAILPAITAQFQIAEGVAPVEKMLAWAQQSAWEEGKLLSAYHFSDFLYLYEHQRLARAQVFLAWARSTNDHTFLHETLAYLQRQQAMAEANHLGWYLIKLRLLQALAHHALSEADAAIDALTAALRRAEPEGYVRLFVDEGEPIRLLLHAVRHTMADAGLAGYLDKLLAAFHEAGSRQSIPSQTQTVPTFPSSIPNLTEPLSEREREILHLVADGLSNREIASVIIVTVGTVKKHLNNIYGKLGVASRTQAIARGRELEML